jgi:hypothetical protein
MAKLTCRDIEKLLISKLPDIDHNDELVEDVSDDRIRIRMPFRPQYMGNDVWQDTGSGVFSGPKVMGFADTAMYACMHAVVGAARYHIPIGTLRDWEQGRVEPDQAARAYLTVIAREPEAVRKALSSPPRPQS